MELFVKIIVCLIAGLGAGFGTGLAGLSAAAVISPMLITFLGMDAYQAIGIALASDVLASAAERENRRFAVSEETGQKKKGDTKVSPL